MSGRATGRGGYGGNIAGTGAPVVGAWLLTPEAVAYSFSFEGRVQRGRRRGQPLSATLILGAQPSGRLDGTFTLDDGTTLAAEGRLDGGNLQVTVRMPGMGVVMGIATRKQITILSVPHDQYTGTFVGPGDGNGGTWVAISQ